MKRLLFYIIGSLLWLYCRTWRYKIINEDRLLKLQAEGKTAVIAIWHDQLLPLTFSWRGRNLATIASQSKDGDLITDMLMRWGYSVARGSSTRGGLRALISVKKFMDKGHSVAVTVDGPLGPRHEVKSGAVYVAKISKSPLMPVLFHSKWMVRFKSWDRFVLPLPFAKINMVITDFVSVTDDISPEGLEQDRLKLQKIMLERTNEHSPDFV